MEQGFCSDTDQSGLGVTSHESSPRRSRGRPGRMLAAVHMGALAGRVRSDGLILMRSGPLAASRRMGERLMVRDAREGRPHHEVCMHTGVPRNSFNITINYFSKPAAKPPVTRPNGDAVHQAIGQRRCCPFIAGGRPPVTSIHREICPCPNVLHFYPPPPLVRWP